MKKALYIDDAIHFSVCAVNIIDYLRTWNCKHLTNAEWRKTIDSIIQDSGYISHAIGTPEELMEV